MAFAIKRLIDHQNQGPAVDSDSIDAFKFPIATGQDLKRVEDMLVDKKQVKYLVNVLMFIFDYLHVHKFVLI